MQDQTPSKEPSSSLGSGTHSTTTQKKPDGRGAASSGWGPLGGLGGHGFGAPPPLLNPLGMMNPLLGQPPILQPGLGPVSPGTVADQVKEGNKALQQQAVVSPTPGPGAPVAKEPEPDPKRLAEQASLLNKSMKGWGTDEGGLLDTLRTVGSAKELAALRTLYKQQYGTDLDAHIRGELGGKDLKEAEKLLSGDRVGYAKTALENACKGIGTDEGKIKSVLNGLTEADRQQLVKGNPALRQMISSELSGKDKEQSLALIDGNKAKATAAKLNEAMNGGFLGLGTDEKAVTAALEEASRNGNLSEVRAAYAELRKGSWTGSKTLDGALASELSGDDKKIADARLRGAEAAEQNKTADGQYKPGFGTTFLSGIRNDTFDAKMHGQSVNGSANGYGVYAPNPTVDLTANSNGLLQGLDRMTGASGMASGAADPISDIAAVTQYAAAADKIQEIDPKTGQPKTTDPKTGKFDPTKVDWAALDKVPIASNLPGGVGPDGKPLATTAYDTPGQLATNGSTAAKSAMKDPTNPNEFIAITGHSGGGQSSFYTALKLASEGYKNISVVGVDMAMTPAQRKMLEDSGVKVTNITSNNRGEGAEKKTSEIGEFIRVGMGGGENYYDLNVDRQNQVGAVDRHGVDNDANVATMVRFAQWLDSQAPDKDGKSLHGQFSPEQYARFLKENPGADTLQVHERREDPATGQPFSVITDKQTADKDLLSGVQDNRGKSAEPTIQSAQDFKNWFDNFATGMADESLPGWVKFLAASKGANLPNIIGNLAGEKTEGLVGLLNKAGVDTSHIAGLPGSEAAQQQIADSKAKAETEALDKEDADAKKIDPEALKKTAGELFSAMDGWGTSEDKLLTALRTVKSKEQMDALRALYKDRYNKNLDDQIKDEIGGDDMKEAQLLLNGDRVGHAKQALLNAGGGMGTDEGKIFETLEGMTERERRKLFAESGPELTKLIDSEMSGSDKKLAMALLNGKKAEAAAVQLEDAMHGGLFGLGTDEAKINTVLEKAKTDGTLKEVSTAYYDLRKDQGSGSTLEKDLKSELSGTDKDESVSLLKGDTAGAQMARLKAAADGMGTDEKKIFSILGELKDDNERKKFIEEYDRRYGSDRPLDQVLKTELSGVDLDRASQLKASGRVDDELLLVAAMKGIGTDEELLKETLKGKSKADIEKLIKSANAKYGKDYGDFGKWVKDEVSGRDGAEVEYMLEHGGPQTPEQKYQFEKHMYGFERGNSNFISRGLTDMYSDSGQILDWQNQRMTTVHDQGTEGGKQLTEEQKSQRLAELVDHHGANVKHYQEAKDTVADGASTVAGVVATGAAIIASGGTASPLALAFWGNMGNLATKALVKGDSYANEDFGIDVTKGVAEMVTAGLMDTKYAQKLTESLAGKLTTPLAQVLSPGALQNANKFVVGGLANAPGGFTGGLTESVLDEKNYEGKFLDGVAGIGGKTLKNTLGSFLGGGTGNLTKGLLPENAPSWMGEGTFNTFKGVTSGMSKGLAGNVIDGSYSGRWEDIAMNWAKPILKEGVGGGLEGYGEFLKSKNSTGGTEPTDAGTQSDQTPAVLPPVTTQEPTSTPALPPTLASGGVLPTPDLLPTRLFDNSPHSDADVFDYLSR